MERALGVTKHTGRQRLQHWGLLRAKVRALGVTRHRETMLTSQGPPDTQRLVAKAAAQQNAEGDASQSGSHLNTRSK